MFTAHGLAVSEVYVSLVEADRRGDVELLGFDAEPASWRRFVGSAGATVTVKPDAYVVLGNGDEEEHRFHRGRPRH